MNLDQSMDFDILTLDCFGDCNGQFLQDMELMSNLLGYELDLKFSTVIFPYHLMMRCERVVMQLYTSANNCATEDQCLMLMLF